MKRSLLAALPLVSALLAVQTAAAAPSQSVVVVQPEPATCLHSKTLLAALAASGPYFPSVVPAAVSSEPPHAPLFKITGQVGHLRLRGWGLRPALPGEQAPLGSPDSTADLDKTLIGKTCENVEQAVVEQLAKALAQAATDRAAAPSGQQAATAQAVQSVLINAQRQLGGQPQMAASVEGNQQGLSLIVADFAGTCRRGTWLDASKPEGLRLGAPVAQLRTEVLACLQRPPLQKTPVANARAADKERGRGEPREVDGIFYLPEHAGAAVAGLGVVVSAAAVAGSDESAALLFGALPLLAGGVASYAVSERFRQPVILGGYWLGMAGASLVSASKDDAPKSWLIGGALAGGALTSASLAILTGFRRGDESSLPAWTVALPSTIGAGVAAVSLFTGPDGPRSVPLAALGAMAALIPNAWLFYRLEGDSADRTPRVGALADTSTVGLVVSGEF